MKKDTTAKKVWQKPEVSDLDVNKTASKPNFTGEGDSYGPSGS
jgi:hypothetical protein